MLSNSDHCVDRMVRWDMLELLEVVQLDGIEDRLDFAMGRRHRRRCDHLCNLKFELSEVVSDSDHCVNRMVC